MILKPDVGEVDWSATGSDRRYADVDVHSNRSNGELTFSAIGSAGSVTLSLGQSRRLLCAVYEALEDLSGWFTPSLSTAGATAPARSDR